MNHLKLGKILLAVMCGLMVLFLMLADHAANPKLCGILSLLSAAIGVGAWLVLGRCQDCGRLVGRTSGKYCSHCGAKLDW